jgi:hypothetical protein
MPIHRPTLDDCARFGRAMHRRQMQGRGPGGRRARGGGGGAAAPTNTVAPVISGTVSIGNSIALTPGTWTGTPSLTYTLFRGATAVVGPGASEATVEAYLLTASAIDDTVNITVRETDSVGGNYATSNALAFAPDTRFPLLAIGISTTGLTLADSDTTVDSWAAMYGGKKSAVTLSAPAATNRPAYDATGGPGGRPLVTWDGVDNVLRSTAVTMGYDWNAHCMHIVGYCVGAETAGDIMMRYEPAGRSAAFTVTSTPQMRFITSGTGGTTSVGTTTITGSHRLMSARAVALASGVQSLHINNGAAEDSDAITVAAWTDGQQFVMGASASGTLAVNLRCIGWALGARDSASAVLDSSQNADLYAFFQNKTGVA